MMRDIDIRTALHSVLGEQYRHDPDTLIVDELGLCQGRARVDVAVVTGTLHGYEIKSEQDTLYRLPTQAAVYSASLNRVTVVASRRHIAALQAMVPIWWGIQQADEACGAVDLVEVRPALDNPEIDPFAVAQMLWRDEAMAALRTKGLADGLTSKPRKVLWRVLADSLTIEELCYLVRQILTTRPPTWRAAGRRQHRTARVQVYLAPGPEPTMIMEPGIPL